MEQDGGRPEPEVKFLIITNADSKDAKVEAGANGQGRIYQRMRRLACEGVPLHKMDVYLRLDSSVQTINDLPVDVDLEVPTDVTLGRLEDVGSILTACHALLKEGNADLMNAMMPHGRIIFVSEIEEPPDKTE